VTVRLVAGLLVTVAALGVAAYRVAWLGRLVWAGRGIPPERVPSIGGAISRSPAGRTRSSENRGAPL
jgi:hypothetical protein